MASSAIGLMSRNKQIPILFTHYKRFLKPTLTSHRNNATEKRNEEPEVQPAQDNVQQQDLSKENETLTNEVKQLKEKGDELLDKYKRSLADNENLRTRLTKQIQDAKIFGIQGFCKDLIEVADILEAATISVPKEEISDKNPHLKSLYEGLTMTSKSLQSVFQRNGLEQVNPVNEKFDPNFHEALFQKEDADISPNTVIQVSKVGYKLHGRCIRPALVGVSKAK
ncbi:grpE protein homolog, mitochondrial [Condylostylus longicornis]|uniref:grpE protein homolog, mitochondrial n=1 Tax=Condylostylus longicornis TaxID=2530218 RepID=UPI00244DB1B5|nr:grpE protein homolog, mitochondrial [Condylostylus longicornis]